MRVLQGEGMGGKDDHACNARGKDSSEVMTQLVQKCRMR